MYQAQSYLQQEQVEKSTALYQKAKKTFEDALEQNIHWESRFRCHTNLSILYKKTNLQKSLKHLQSAEKLMRQKITIPKLRSKLVRKHILGKLPGTVLKSSTESMLSLAQNLARVKMVDMSTMEWSLMPILNMAL